MKFRAAVFSLFALALSAFALAVVGDAQASFPGSNGQLAVAHGDGNIYVIKPDGTGQRLLTQGFDPDWSPNGGKIAFVRTTVFGHDPHQDGIRNGDLFTINADGTGLRQLTVGGRWAHPAWSPDGTKIAGTYRVTSTAGESDNRYDIRIVNVADRTVMPFADTVDQEADPAWSPDGWRIAYERFPRIWVQQLNADGDEGKRDTGLVGRAPDWSPDGRNLVYIHDTSNGSEILVKNPDGHRAPLQLARDLNDRLSSPSWSPDGMKIAFTRSDHSVYIINATGGGETYVTNGLTVDWQGCSLVGLRCVSHG